VVALIEGAHESEARLNRRDSALPVDLHGECRDSTRRVSRRPQLGAMDARVTGSPIVGTHPVTPVLPGSVFLGATVPNAWRRQAFSWWSRAGSNRQPIGICGSLAFAEVRQGSVSAGEKRPCAFPKFAGVRRSSRRFGREAARCYPSAPPSAPAQAPSSAPQPVRPSPLFIERGHWTSDQWRSAEEPLDVLLISRSNGEGHPVFQIRTD
jgi:hypothetical protein